MRTRIVNLLLLAALVFAGARLWQYLGSPPPGLPAIGAAAPGPPPQKRPEAKPADAEARPENYDVIVARDLFSATRGVVAPAPSIAPKPAAKPVSPPKLTLYGVVILDGEKTAFLQEGAVESRPKKVKEKESFAGGVVTAIRPDGVTFLFAGTEITIPLRTPKDGAGPAAPGGKDPGNAARADAPAAFPRRPAATNVMPGQPIVPGRPPAVPTRGPTAVMPGEPGVPGGDEDFPEGFGPEGQGPGGDGAPPPDEDTGE